MYVYTLLYVIMHSPSTLVYMHYQILGYTPISTRFASDYKSCLLQLKDWRRGGDYRRGGYYKRE